MALAGFASLATVLGRRYRHTDPLVNAIRLRGLLDAGLSTMLLALIAVLVMQGGGEREWVWRAVALVGLVFVGTIVPRRSGARSCAGTCPVSGESSRPSCSCWLRPHSSASH